MEEWKRVRAELGADPEPSKILGGTLSHKISGRNNAIQELRNMNETSTDIRTFSGRQWQSHE
jgi:hypothetical protein